MANISFSTEEKVPFTFAPTSPSGNPAILDGPITAEVVSGDVTVEVGSDGLSGFIIAGSTVGDAQVIFSGDADLSVGIRTIQETVDVTITNAEAATLGLTLGLAQPK